MTRGRKQKTPLKALSEDEQQYLEMLSRARSAPAVQVERARLLLCVADGMTFKTAAAHVSRRDAHSVSLLVKRFNDEGLRALVPRHGGGHQLHYGTEKRERILREFRRTPSVETDGCATWSLSILQRILRNAPDGLPKVSTFTIHKVLHEAGYSFSKDRSWCQAGVAKRKRKGRLVEVHDPEADTKKN